MAPYEPYHWPSAIRSHGFSQRDGVPSKPRNTTGHQRTIVFLAQKLVSLGRLAAEARRAKRYSILLVMLLLQGCVFSQVPLLEDKTAIIEPSFTGHYRLSELEKLPRDWDIYIKENRYILIPNPKDIFVATLHSFDDGVYIAQSRKIGDNSRYLYFLVRKAENLGLEINFIPCDAGCSPIESIESLNTMAANAVSHFNEQEFAKAEKTSELGR
jgi:hypothetical protein